MRLLATGSLLVLAAGCTVQQAPASGPTTDATPALTASPAQTTAPPRTGDPGPGASHAQGIPDAAAATIVTTLVRQRSDALARRDKISWLATIADPTSADGLAEAEAYDALVALGVTALQVGPVGPAPSPPASSGDPSATRSTVPPTASRAAWTGSVELGYLVPGVDRDVRHIRRTVTVVDFGGQWRLGRWLGPADRPEVWDLPGMQVARTGSVVVAGNQPVGNLARLAAEAEVAQQQVARAVRAPATPALIVLPSTSADAADLLGHADAGVLRQVAATTDGPRSPGRAAMADRVVVNPDGLARLTGTGRHVVLAHELTHVTMRATTGHDVPMWLSEGFAEWVAYQDQEAGATTVARQLLDTVAVSGPPAALPSAADFDPVSGDVAAAYQASWLAVSRIARQRGPERLLAFYRDVAGSPADGRTTAPATVLARAFTTQVGESEATFTELWRAELTALAR